MNIKIKVSEDLVNYIEALQYDTEGLKDLIARMAQLNSSNSELNNYWIEKYLNKNAEYNIAKSELEKEFIKPNIKENKKYSWVLDFDSCEVTVTYNE